MFPWQAVVAACVVGIVLGAWGMLALLLWGHNAGIKALTTPPKGK